MQEEKELQRCTLRHEKCRKTNEKGKFKDTNKTGNLKIQIKGNAKMQIKANVMMQIKSGEMERY